MFGAGAQAQERQRLRAGVAALFGSKKVMKIKTGDIYEPHCFFRAGSNPSEREYDDCASGVVLHGQIHAVYGHRAA